MRQPCVNVMLLEGRRQEWFNVMWILYSDRKWNVILLTDYVRTETFLSLCRCRYIDLSYTFWHNNVRAIPVQFVCWCTRNLITKWKYICEESCYYFLLNITNVTRSKVRTHNVKATLYIEKWTWNGLGTQIYEKKIYLYCKVWQIVYANNKINK